jgi:hypothetical protein
MSDLRGTAPSCTFLVWVERIVFELVMETNPMHVFEDPVTFSLHNHRTPAALADFLGRHWTKG